jgi:hypothetical protein
VPSEKVSEGVQMRAWLPWDPDNFNLLDWWGPDDLDDDVEEEEPVVETVPASEDSDEERLTVPQIVELGAGLVSKWAVRRAITAGTFPSAEKRAVRPGRGGVCWTVPRSEVERWLERLGDG